MPRSAHSRTGWLSCSCCTLFPPAPPGFSHVHITSPWLCHSCNSCLLIPHHSSSLLHSLLSPRRPRTKTMLIQLSPWCRMQGLLGRGCVRQDNNYIFEQKKTLQIVRKLCLSVLWEDQHPEDFHLGSQQAQTKTHGTWVQESRRNSRLVNETAWHQSEKWTNLNPVQLLKHRHYGIASDMTNIVAPSTEWLSHWQFSLNNPISHSIHTNLV